MERRQFVGDAGPPTAFHILFYDLKWEFTKEDVRIRGMLTGTVTRDYTSTSAFSSFSTHKGSHASYLANWDVANNSQRN